MLVMEFFIFYILTLELIYKQHPRDKPEAKKICNDGSSGNLIISFVIIFLRFFFIPQFFDILVFPWPMILYVKKKFLTRVEKSRKHRKHACGTN